MVKKVRLWLCAVSVLVSPLGYAEESFRVEPVVTLSGVPWGLAQLDKTTLLYTLRGGEAGIIDLSNNEATALRGLPAVAAGGQGGLLDVAVPDDYRAGDWIYFTYSKPVKQKMAATTLARAKLNGQVLHEWSDLLVSQSASTRSTHFGSRITFDQKGHVYFGIGDRGTRQHAQDGTNHAGSILRLKRDGSIPTDNPYRHSPTILPETYSIGHRNPQGLHFDAVTQRLWEVEHGPRGGDEINQIHAGKNYGWPVISYGKEYWAPIMVGESTKKAGMEQPVKVYTPSIAPSSLVVYRGNAFPKWQGNILVSALKLTHINRIELNESGQSIAETRLLSSLGERIRDLLVSTEGYVYFTTDSGKVMRLVPRL